MKDFLNYKPEENSAETPINGDIFATFSSLASKYEGKSADEMMAAILAEAEKERKNGTLSDADIDKFVAVVSPMLSDKQRKMLKTVVARLKKQ